MTMRLAGDLNFPVGDVRAMLEPGDRRLIHLAALALSGVYHDLELRINERRQNPDDP